MPLATSSKNERRKEVDSVDWTRDEFVLTDESNRRDLNRTFLLLQGTYWGVLAGMRNRVILGVRGGFLKQR